MKYQTLNILLLPFLLAAMLAGIYLMPRKGEVSTPPSAWNCPRD